MGLAQKPKCGAIKYYSRPNVHWKRKIFVIYTRTYLKTGNWYINVYVNPQVQIAFCRGSQVLGKCLMTVTVALEAFFQLDGLYLWFIIPEWHVMSRSRSFSSENLNCTIILDQVLWRDTYAVFDFALLGIQIWRIIFFISKLCYQFRTSYFETAVVLCKIAFIKLIWSVFKITRLHKLCN